MFHFTEVLPGGHHFALNVEKVITLGKYSFAPCTFLPQQGESTTQNTRKAKIKAAAS